LVEFDSAAPEMISVVVYNQEVKQYKTKENTVKNYQDRKWNSGVGQDNSPFKSPRLPPLRQRPASNPFDTSDIRGPLEEALNPQIMPPVPGSNRVDTPPMKPTISWPKSRWPQDEWGGSYDQQMMNRQGMDAMEIQREQAEQADKALMQQQNLHNQQMRQAEIRGNREGIERERRSIPPYQG
tara:strand:+ start:2226 stop:2771 length:546 start_codon:yes stop_codon:yes gene_type:complete